MSFTSLWAIHSKESGLYFKCRGRLLEAFRYGRYMTIIEKSCYYEIRARRGKNGREINKSSGSYL